RIAPVRTMDAEHGDAARLRLVGERHMRELVLAPQPEQAEPAAGQPSDGIRPPFGFHQLPGPGPMLGDNLTRKVRQRIDGHLSRSATFWNQAVIASGM